MKDYPLINAVLREHKSGEALEVAVAIARPRPYAVNFWQDAIAVAEENASRFCICGMHLRGVTVVFEIAVPVDVDVDAFRLDARAWLTAALDKRAADSRAVEEPSHG